MTELTQADPALALFEAGRLSEAVAAASERVKANPADIRLRSQLAELLCVAGELERAERQFDAIASQDPTTAIRATELRQFVRADLARREVWMQGRMPEFLLPPPPHVELRLQALMHLRAGRMDEAADHIARAETERPEVAGAMNDVPFDDFRDLDDLTGGILEVMTTMGKYFWVPLEHVVDAVVTPPSRPLDAAWCTMELTVRDGTTGQVVVPAIYADLPAGAGVAAASEAQAALYRTGRETEWVEEAPNYVRGQGLRCFLVGEDAVSIRDLGALVFEAP